MRMSPIEVCRTTTPSVRGSVTLQGFESASSSLDRVVHGRRAGVDEVEWDEGNEGEMRSTHTNDMARPGSAWVGLSVELLGARPA